MSRHEENSWESTNQTHCFRKDSLTSGLCFMSLRSTWHFYFKPILEARLLLVSTFHADQTSKFDDILSFSYEPFCTEVNCYLVIFTKLCTHEQGDHTTHPSLFVIRESDLDHRQLVPFIEPHYVHFLAPFARPIKDKSSFSPWMLSMIIQLLLESGFLDSILRKAIILLLAERGPNTTNHGFNFAVMIITPLV